MITGKILKTQGWEQGKALGLAKRAAQRLEQEGMEREAVLARLDQVRGAPDSFLADPILADLARELARTVRRAAEESVAPALRGTPLPYRVWGAEQIDAAARAQMDQAMRLPVSVAGALMPDAHVGYGLPIGGVLATEGTVIPYAVGVDIACRMRLSIYPTSPALLDQEPARFQQALLQNTHFGAGVTNPARPEHAILEDEAWTATRLLRPLRDVAARQLGTSGTGNHFVEWGRLTLLEADPRLGLAAGDYLALLSHSGSRGVGFKIANAYSTLATQLHPHLEKSVQHLAWLSLDSEPGQEYWQAMELAGRFASANHQVIHLAVARAAGLSEVAVVENFHNWAARETVAGADGREQEVIVHRKGATPAAQGVLGVIPGSMADAGYIVRGLGEPAALRSAAHGAGRAMSRKAALHTISREERDRYLAEHRITLLGGGLDESPQAYKRIEDVIAAQQDLVELIGRFRPRIVRMASEPGDI